MATEVIATEGEAMYAWLIWILPFIAALIIPAVGKFSKISTGRVAIGFAAMSAISAAVLLPMALDGHEIHDQIDWISAIGLKAGVLADPLSIIMAKAITEARKMGYIMAPPFPINSMPEINVSIIFYSF